MLVVSVHHGLLLKLHNALDYSRKRSGVREKTKHKGLIVIASVTRWGARQRTSCLRPREGEALPIHVGAHDRRRAGGFLLALLPVGCAGREEQEQPCRGPSPTASLDLAYPAIGITKHTVSRDCQCYWLWRFAMVPRLQDRSGSQSDSHLWIFRHFPSHLCSREDGTFLTNAFVGLFVIALACPKVVRLYRTYLRIRTVV
jgi:hypothetical protein